MEQANAVTGRSRRNVTNADSSPDPGLAALRSAMTAYTALREELAEERQGNADLIKELHEARRAADVEQRRVTTLLNSLRHLHGALYSGTTSEHILRASMDVTGAERGYYVADSPHGLRIRAAVDVPANVGDEPSAFIAGISRQVLETGEAVHWSASEPPAGLTPSDDERFREGIAVPVSALGAPHGVIIALDKNGDFHESEVRSLLNVGTEAGVAIENARLRTEVQRAYVATISVLSDAVQAKDPYTHGHCEQVSQYARAASDRLGMSEDEKRVTCYAALLHDVGKIGVSDGVLNKPGPLLAEERKLVEAHVRIGHDLINGVPALHDIASAILYHHEWYDGNGYPDGLAGEQIPIASRIVAVVDAYCAMMDRRSYKEARTKEWSRDELRRCAGSQFDPRVVDAVLLAIEEVDAAGSHAPAFDAGCGILPLLHGNSLAAARLDRG